MDGVSGAHRGGLAQEAAMIVLRRLASGVWDHAGARFTEWLGLVPLMGVGTALYLSLIHI